jgi:hypothetical protein
MKVGQTFLLMMREGETPVVKASGTVEKDLGGTKFIGKVLRLGYAYSEAFDATTPGILFFDDPHDLQRFLKEFMPEPKPPVSAAKPSKKK